MNLAIIDVVFCVLILVLAINGAAKGFIAELFGKAAFLGGLVLGFLFCNSLAQVLIQWISVVILAQILSFLLIFVVTFLVIKILQHILGGLFKGDILGSLDRALGFFLGLAEGVLLVVLVLFVLHAQPWIDTTELLRGSFFDRLLVEPVNQSVELLSEGIEANV